MGFIIRVILSILGLTVAVLSPGIQGFLLIFGVLFLIWSS